MTQRLYFIRHGETDWNLEKKMQGWIDTVLNQTGKNQAQTAILALKQYPIERIISSTLTRAKETALIINTHFQVPFTQTDAFKEINLGDIEGKTDSFIQHIDSQITLKIPTNDNECYPNGESWNDVIHRVKQEIIHIATHFREKHILIVTHGGVLYKLYAYITNETKLFENCRGFSVCYNPLTRVFSDIRLIV